mgnify:CR=1 FL=1
MKKVLINIATPIAILGLSLVIAAVAWKMKKPAEAAIKQTEIPVSTTPAIERRMTNRLRAKGSAYAVERAEISPKVPGVLESLLVDEGDAVIAGQIVAHIDSTQLTLAKRNAEAAMLQAVAGKASADVGETMAQIGVEQARLACAQADAQIQTARATIEQADAGVRQAIAANETAVAHRRAVDSDYQRMRNLFENKAATRQQLDHATAQQEAAQIGRASCRERV